MIVNLIQNQGAYGRDKLNYQVTLELLEITLSLSSLPNWQTMQACSQDFQKPMVLQFHTDYLSWTRLGINYLVKMTMNEGYYSFRVH